MRRTRSFAGILAAVLLALAVHAVTVKAAGLDLSAPLPVDPNVRIVTLPNGLRCWLRAHKTPPERVGIWLHVGSGSINEDDDQRGLAHLLEHMAFEGSEHFPPGQLVKYFESIGLTFGYHQNAFTSFDQTTFVLTLPNTDAETVQKGLLCMADFAFRLSLLPERIEKERGVVLQEMDARKGPGQRMFEKLLPTVLPGSRVAERLPIGLADVVRGATREQLVRYYTRWYRPDDSVLMIVGDVDLDKTQAMVEAAFADWRPVADPPADAPLGIVPYSKTRAAVISDPEVTSGDVSIIGVRPVEEEKTIGDFRRSLVGEIGRWVVNRRLDDMVSQGKAPFQSASLHKSTLWNVCTYLEAEASGAPENWREMLLTLAVEVKRAREHGILPQELEDARKAMLASAEQAARTESTRDARTVLAAMNDLVSEHREPMSAAQRCDLLKALIGTVTAEEVAESLRHDFSLDACLLLATLPEAEGRPLPTQDDLLAVAAEAEAQQVAPPVARARPAGLLEHEPRPGAVARQEIDPDLQILSATLTNGVRIHLRSMDFKKDEVLVRIVLAGGVPWETAGSRGLTDVAALAFQQPATSRLSSTEIRDLLTGRNVKLSGGAALDSVVLDLGGSPEDIEEGFRLVHALLTDPVIEPAALETWRESTRQRLESQRTDVRAQLGEATNRLLSGDDLRFRPLTPALLDGLTVVDGQRWLDRLVRSAPIEVAVVGDIGRERALELVLKYLGSLPARDEVGPLADDLRRVSMRPGPLTKTVEVDTVTPTAATLVGWRGADWTDVKERRCLQLAAQIITSRLREELRQKRGLAYSPYCTARAAQTYPGTGLFASFLAGDPANVAEAVELMRNVMEGFAKDGPTEQEMATVRKQFANDIETQQKEPRYWLGVLSEADYIGTRLSDVKEVMARYTGYTGKDLQRVARKYMTDERRVEVTARPR